MGKAELMSKGEAGLIVVIDVEVYLAKTELVKAVADKGMSSLRPKALTPVVRVQHIAHLYHVLFPRYMWVKVDGTNHLSTVL